MNPLITVIVPVYNVENYLEKCLDSIISQTYGNIEIILVDDGSADNSGKICDSFGEKDSRIITVHKKNEGVAVARNTGLDMMKGQYVCFIDGDDYIANDYIECLYDALVYNNADASTCGHYRAFDDGRLERVFNFGESDSDILVMTGNEALCDVFYGINCSASSCCKLYSSKLFESIRFKKYTMGEDSFTLFRLFLASKRVVHTNHSKYYYVQRSGSAMHRENNNIRFYDYVRIYDEFYKYIENCDKEIFYAFANRLVENNFFAYMKLRKSKKDYTVEKRHIADNIKKYRRFVIINPKSQMRTKYACILSYFGMRTINTIYDIIEKKHK